MALILKNEQFGAYAKFKHEPSTKECAEVSIEILNKICLDLKEAKGVLISIDRYDVIYHTPQDDQKWEGQIKALDPLFVSNITEVKWTWGIKASVAFLVQQDDQYTAFEQCQMRLREGVSIEPYRTIE